jgi:DHA3 family macrolide efflux protein-like MFS transporter
LIATISSISLSGLGLPRGIQVVLYVSSGTFFLFVLSLSRLRLKGRESQTSQRRSGHAFSSELKEGLRYVFLKRRTIAGIVLTALCYSLASSAFVFLLPVLADKVLHVGAMMLGWLWSAYGAGMVLISIVLAVSKQRVASIRVLFITGAMLIGGAASFILSVTATPLFSMALVAIIGAGLAAFTPIVWGPVARNDA